MRQLVQNIRSGKVEVVDVPDPEVRPGTVFVQTSCSLISAGTEQAVAAAAAKGWLGKARERPEAVKQVIGKARLDGIGSAVGAVRARLDDLLTPGYSSAGVVIAVGAGVTELRPGQRVACVGANAAVHAERAVVPAPLCTAIPDGVTDAQAAFAAVGAIAAHGVRTAGVEAGSVVAVIGLGLVGQLAAQLATAAGARVVGVDLAPDRVELARRLGAVGGTAAGPEAAASEVQAASDGLGADGILITAASKDPGLLDLAAALARDRAIVCVVGDVPLAGSRTLYYLKELQLRVSRSYGPGRYDDEYEIEGMEYPIGYVRWTERRLIRYFLEEIAAGRVRTDELVTHEFPIEQGIDAYAALDDPARLAILLRYPERPATSKRAQTKPAPTRRTETGDLRVGLIGPGAFARSTLLPMLKRENVRLVAVAGATPARAFGVGRRWSAEYAAADPEELMADATIEAVVIATRHDSHARFAERALAAGKAVFLEKPLAIDVDGLTRIESALGAGGKLVVDFNRNFAPATVAVAEHFAARRDPLSVVYRVNAGYLEPSDWTRDPQIGGGRLVGEACHFVEWCSALIASPVARVAVTSLGLGTRTLDGDNFHLTLTYADGSVATIVYVAGGDRSAGKERIEAHGAGRSAVIDDFRRVALHGGAGVKRPRNRVRDKGHAAAMAAALRFFREGGEPPIPYVRLVETTRVTLVARDALMRGDASPQPVI